jgi:Fe-S-cluster containining protein
MAHFECDGCGVCCRSYLIFASETDAAREPRIAREGRRLPSHLATADWTFQLFPLPFHETCCFLDEAARCTIYPSRPGVCRAFAAGGPQCQDARARAGLPPLDPVAVAGPLPGSGA